MDQRGYSQYKLQNNNGKSWLIRNSKASELMVKFIRQIGVKRILFGSDAATGTNLRPRESWEAFCQLKLSKKEIKTIAGNVAPYFR